MEITFPPEIQAFMQRQVKNGKYADTPALIFAALELLQKQEDIYQGRLLDLQQEALIGWDALQKGEVVDGEEGLTSIRDRLRIKHSPES
ncbi:type II toxin-antitoxin system ParD family antitoxin [[Limnothrix rosea] IAM M-220]|uniref:ribbon-helix-helix domain-containing protein n=1 Tax=[Limnothrix rosea] IAM M-220 TaxID=454133 RepID=UPI00095BF34B|nr:CopG family transcriptional regulator [[Limnothrix rosea] IAM M-220]OKH16073.1 CopG family transcriptional regulator [[Limnothrix rosea] IAM M-220]